MVTLDTDSEEYGMVYGQGVHKIGRFAAVEAVAKEGYSFVGWYEGDQLASEEENN